MTLEEDAITAQPMEGPWPRELGQQAGEDNRHYPYCTCKDENHQDQTLKETKIKSDTSLLSSSLPTSGSLAQGPGPCLLALLGGSQLEAKPISVLLTSKETIRY